MAHDQAWRDALALTQRLKQQWMAREHEALRFTRDEVALAVARREIQKCAGTIDMIQREIDALAAPND